MFDDGSPPPSCALLSFSVRNVRSYWEEATFSLLGTRLSDPNVVRGLKVTGHAGRVSVLPTAGIFGANASGKSTILRAMADMRGVVLRSFSHGDKESGLQRHPFLLNREGSRHPSHFAIDLILDGVRWQYGFEIDDRRVLGEYAYYYPKGRQALVFRRERDEPVPRFGPGLRASGRLLGRLLRANSLLLSVAGAVADGPGDELPAISGLLDPLFSWFRTNLLLMESDNRMGRIAVTADGLRIPEVRQSVLALLQAADLGITEIERVKMDPEFAERLKRALRVLDGVEDKPTTASDEQLAPGDLVRLGHAGKEGSVPIEPEHESLGTLVWVSMAGPVLAVLRRGSIVLVDELDASLHPHLVQRFVQLFQTPETNPWCAQLVFNAHDTTILGDSGQRALGRDQIWFTEKNAAGATALYSLAEFQPKRDEALGRRYLQGRYGAVPVLDPAEFQVLSDATGS